MRDSLRFIARRDGPTISVVCTGFDAQGNPVCFDIDPRQLKANQCIELDWTQQVINAERTYTAMCAAGMDPDTAWTWARELLPRPLSITTAAERVAQFADEVLEGVDDAGR